MSATCKACGGSGRMFDELVLENPACGVCLGTGRTPETPGVAEIADAIRRGNFATCKAEGPVRGGEPDPEGTVGATPRERAAMLVGDVGLDIPAQLRRDIIRRVAAELDTWEQLAILYGDGQTTALAKQVKAESQRDTFQALARDAAGLLERAINGETTGNLSPTRVIGDDIRAWLARWRETTL